MAANNSEELAVIEDLLQAFSVSGLTAAEALKKIESRYNRLFAESSRRLLRSNFLKTLSDYDREENISALAFILIVHEFLFIDILFNAGQFRQATEPAAGRVGFGRANLAVRQEFRYTGVPPNEIESKLRDAYSCLRFDSADPIASAFEFYQRFVYIHPFYDANGRIARLIVTLYLDDLFHYSIRWKDFTDGTPDAEKFVKLLNKCHDMMKRPNPIAMKSARRKLEQFLTPFLTRRKDESGGDFQS